MRTADAVPAAGARRLQIPRATAARRKVRRRVPCAFPVPSLYGRTAYRYRRSTGQGVRAGQEKEGWGRGAGPPMKFSGDSADRRRRKACSWQQKRSASRVIPTWTARQPGKPAGSPIEKRLTPPIGQISGRRRIDRENVG